MTKRQNDTAIERIDGQTALSDAELESVAGGGSRSTGVGAGKVAFNPFSITRHIDKASPNLF
jgi:type VI protein secretion system component Hcp